MTMKYTTGLRGSWQPRQRGEGVATHRPRVPWQGNTGNLALARAPPSSVAPWHQSVQARGFSRSGTVLHGDRGRFVPMPPVAPPPHAALRHGAGHTARRGGQMWVRKMAPFWNTHPQWVVLVDASDVCRSVTTYVHTCAHEGSLVRRRTAWSGGHSRLR